MQVTRDRRVADVSPVKGELEAKTAFPDFLDRKDVTDIRVTRAGLEVRVKMVSLAYLVDPAVRYVLSYSYSLCQEDDVLLCFFSWLLYVMARLLKKILWMNFHEF